MPHGGSFQYDNRASHVTFIAFTPMEGMPFQVVLLLAVLFKSCHCLLQLTIFNMFVIN